MNFGTPVPLLLGIFLVLSAVALFFLDKLKPGYGRDSDKIYAILFMLSGVFLLGSLTMELIPSFQQMLMVGMLISLMIQNINARTPLNARSGPPSRDDYPGSGSRPGRPSRPAYYPDTRTNMRAELDMREPGPDPYARPRPMLGARDEQQPPSSRPPYPQDSYPNRYDDGNRYGDGNNPPPDTRLDRPDEPPYYGGGAPRPDERIRRRRPPKTRSDYNDRYRNDPGNSPRPDYRPD